MRAGQLKQRIAIEEPVLVKGGMGGTSTTWQLVDNCRALILPVNGRERLVADALDGELAARCFMRYRADVNETMRIRDLGTGAIYNIVAPPINTRSANRQTELLLSAGLSEG